MKNVLNIGSLKLPKESATKGFAFIGKRGSGKSYNAAVLAEEFSKHHIPFVVFDPIDVWWGLKVAADGKGKGLPVVVFGIQNADILLTRDMGKRIAQAVVKENISCVISTFGMSKVDMRHLIADFSEELLRINNTARHVFIEEAHEFVPQRIFGAGARCFSAVEALLVMGRNKGIGVSLLNQRMATLNKDLVTQIDILMAFRSVGPQDRKALRDWVEAHDDEGNERFNEFMKSIPSLPTGKGWIWSPEFMGIFKLVSIRKRETFHPDREKLGMTFKMPDIKQGDVKSFIDTFTKKPLVEAIKSTALGAVKSANPVPTTPMGVSQWMNYGKKYGYDKFFENQIKNEKHKEFAKFKAQLYKQLLKSHGDMGRALEAMLGIIRPLEGADIVEAPQLSYMKGTTPVPISVEDAKVIRDARPITLDDMPTSSGISKPEQKVLNAIMWFYSIGQTKPSKTAVALIAKVRPTSGGYKNVCSSLRTKGLISYPTPGDISLTHEGMGVAQTPEINATTNEEFHQVILGILSNPEANVLTPLLREHRPLHKEILATLTPYQPSSGGYKNILSSLRTLGLIDYPEPGQVEATSLMYPFAS